MPVRKNIKDKMSSLAANATPEHEPGAAPDETARKVSRLATTTSISAFIAVACLAFSFVTHAQASSTIAEVQSDLVETVIAPNGIPKGSVIKESMLEVAHIPSKYVGEDSVHTLQDAVGRRANVAIGKNSQIQSGELDGQGNTSSLSGRLSKGRKAVSIDVTTESDFAGSLLHQGDRVSLYCFKGEKGSSKTRYELARNVEVLALDGYLSYESLTGNGKVASYSNVTVEVSPAEAIEIRETQDSNKTIWLVLSSEADAKR